MAFYKKWKKTLILILALFLVLAATIVSLGRLLTPLLNEHRADFEKWASQLLNVPVQIGKIDLSWHYYKPVIDLENVILLDKETQQPNFKAEEIKITLGVFASLISAKPLPDYIKVTGVHLTLQELSSGEINLLGFGNFTITDNMTGSSAEGNKMADIVFSQPFLALEDVQVHFTSAKGNVYKLTLNEMSLENAGQKHFFSGDITLHQKIDTDVTVNLNWQGKSFNPAEVNAQLYLYVEGLSLPQWFSEQTWQDLKIKQGLGSAKIWADWKNNQWQKIQSELQLYELEVTSLKTQKTTAISRLRGNIGWKREGENQTLAGDDILIDLPNHLWPTTGFLVKFTQNTQQNETSLHLNSLRIDYVDLADLKEIAFASGLLPDALQQPLTAAAPSGELYKLNIQFTDFDHLENNHYSAEFENLSIKPWDKWPGVQQLDGHLTWDGKHGSINLDAEDSGITVPSIFMLPLAFDGLHADIQVDKDSNGNWLLNTKKIMLDNDDLTATGHFTLNWGNDAPPRIDLAANFAMENAGMISHYLPLHVFDAELRQWLAHAFHDGEITDGQAIVQGDLHDFPFNKGKGKFVISGNVVRLNLRYSPEWPALNQMNGKVIFSGTSMVADVTSATTLNLPLRNLHAEIPAFGAGNTVLNVTGTTHADLAEGERFIFASPLKNTLGKSLADMKLQGPMDLNLKLVVPLGHPKNTQVFGEMNVKNGNLDFPKWKLNAANINGLFHFTENSMSAADVHGLFFAEPVTIAINTEKTNETSSIIKMQMKGAVAATNLEQWLQLPVLNYVRGKTHYTAELQLMLGENNTAAHQIIIQSNLQGVTVNLPAIYGKNSDVARDFQLILSFKQDGPLQLKSNYGNLLTTAITLQQGNSGLEVASGEVRFGSQGQAQWQTQPGLVIAGQMDTINWDEWKNYFSGTANGNAPAGRPSKVVVRSVDIQAKQIVGLSQAVTKVRLQLNRSATNWLATVSSNEMAGKLTVPDDRRQPIDAKFDYLYIVPTAAASKQPLDPKTLPAFSFVGNDVQYRDVQLGKVVLAVSPIKTGMLIKQLRVDSNLFNFNASGDWQSLSKGSQTRLTGTLKASNVSNFLNQWGIKSSNLIGSGGSADFALAWNDAPFSPSLLNMSGNLSLKLTKGRIINLGESTDAKMGIGRMLNILSLQTLPQLLTLNFKSVFAQGYSFDGMKGDFTLKNGSALTQNAKFDSSVARVEFSGRIGLVQKDYNMLLSVTPYVTGSIPIVAAIAVNPIAGVALWAVDKVAQGAVSKVTTYKFVVTGPWANPTLKKQ